MVLLIKIISDVHLEANKKPYWMKEINISEHININFTGEEIIRLCILAGDIGLPKESKYRAFLRDTRLKYDKVIVIPGNHEYYKQEKEGYTKTKQTIDGINILINEICKEEDCIFLNRSHIDIDGVRIIRCVLWSKLDSKYKADYVKDLSCFKNISDFTFEEYNRLNKQDVDYITNMTQTTTLPLIVVTHYPPSIQFDQPKYRSSKSSKGYYNDLENHIIEPIKLWVSGHTHMNLQTHINNVLCVSNCIGYKIENVVYNDDMIIRL